MMKKSLQKLLAIILSITMLSGFGLVTAFAEEPAETTTQTETENTDSAVVENITAIERVMTFFYDLINFLHEQYVTFVAGDAGHDIFAWLFDDSSIGNIIGGITNAGDSIGNIMG